MSDAESVAAQPPHAREKVVAVVDSLLTLLADDEQAYVRAADLDLEGISPRQAGTILSMIADSPETVASLYELDQVLKLSVSRWGRTDNTIRWHVSWTGS